MLLFAPLQQGPFFSLPAETLERTPITPEDTLRIRASFHPAHGAQWAVCSTHLMQSRLAVVPSSQP
eukprot:6449563-Pyramimonas_sp.AAC.1